MNNSIIGTGLSGLVGTRIKELLQEYEFDDLSLSTGVDTSDNAQVWARIEESKAPVILHMAAKTDVDACEDDKIYMEEGAAWRINVIGTENIAQAAKKTGKKLIYISTDFVFNGTKDSYNEDDEPDPICWYAITKYEAEEIVKKSGAPYAIARISYPYRAVFPPKLDFVRRIIDIATKKHEVTALTDHTFTPTFIDDIAEGLDMIIKQHLEGVFHLVGSQYLTPYEAAGKIIDKFGLDCSVKKATREEYFKDRAFRPFKLALKNDKITQYGLNMLDFDRGLSEIKRQIPSY